jgi:hypothetical protein
MSRILLHPHLLPRYGPDGGPRVHLPPPWCWWRHKLRPCPDGALFHQQYDDPTDIHETSILFDLLRTAEIHDPPAMHLVQTPPEFENLAFGDPTRTMMTRGVQAVIDVVWYRRPDDNWHQLPGNTCRPADYSLEMVDRGDERSDDSTRQEWVRDLPPLRWQLVDTGDAAAEGRRIAAAFGVPPALVGIPDTSLDEQVAAIFEASRNYEVETSRRAHAVMMSPQDYAELRRNAQRDADMRLGAYQPAEAPARPFDSIFGLQIVAERSVPRGQFIVVSQDMLADAQRMFTQALEGLGAFGAAMGAVGEASAGLFQQAEPARYGRRDTTWGQRHPDSVAASILPESEVIDEIDRLVNEQIRPGPVDDYHADRYPKCTHCGCDWHGILCDKCDCLGELEDPA